MTGTTLEALQRQSWGQLLAGFFLLDISVVGSHPRRI